MSWEGEEQCYAEFWRRGRCFLHLIISSQLSSLCMFFFLNDAMMWTVRLLIMVMVIWSIAVVSFAAAKCFVLACTHMAVLFGHISVFISRQTNGRSLIYKLTRSRPSIDPCGTPVHWLRLGERWLFTETCWLLTFNFDSIHLSVRGAKLKAGSLAITFTFTLRAFSTP